MSKIVSIVLFIVITFLGFAEIVASNLVWELTPPQGSVRPGTVFFLSLQTSATIPQGTVLELNLDSGEIEYPLSHFMIVGAGGLPYCHLGTDSLEIATRVSNTPHKIAHIDTLNTQKFVVTFIQEITEPNTTILCPFFLNPDIIDDLTITPSLGDMITISIDSSQPDPPDFSFVLDKKMANLTITLPELSSYTLYPFSISFRIEDIEFPQSYISSYITYDEYKSMIAPDARLIIIKNLLYIWTGPKPAVGASFVLPVILPTTDGYDIPTSAAGKPCLAIAFLSNTPSKPIHLTNVLRGKIGNAQFFTSRLLDDLRIEYNMIDIANSDQPTINMLFTGYHLDVIYGHKAYLTLSVNGNEPSSVDISTKPLSLKLTEVKKGDSFSISAGFTLLADESTPYKYMSVTYTFENRSIFAELIPSIQIVANNINYPSQADIITFDLNILVKDDWTAVYVDSIPFNTTLPLKYDAGSHVDLRKMNTRNPLCVSKQHQIQISFQEQLFDDFDVLPSENPLVVTISGSLLNGNDIITLNCQHAVIVGPKPQSDLTLSIGSFKQPTPTPMPWPVAQYKEYNQVVIVNGPSVQTNDDVQLLLKITVAALRGIHGLSLVTVNDLRYAVLSYPQVNAHSSQGIHLQFFQSNNVAIYSNIGSSLTFVFNRDPKFDPIDTWIFTPNYEFTIKSAKSIKGLKNLTPSLLNGFDEQIYVKNQAIVHSFGISCWSSAQCASTAFCSKQFCSSPNEISVTRRRRVPDDTDATPFTNCINLITLASMITFFLFFSY